MTINLEVKAQGALTGVMLVALAPRVDESNNPVEPTLYFLCWNGIACSPRLHVSLEAAIGELIALESGQLLMRTMAQLLSALSPEESELAVWVEAWEAAGPFDWTASSAAASPELKKALSVDMFAAMTVVEIPPQEAREFRAQKPGAFVVAVSHNDTVEKTLRSMGFPASFQPEPRRTAVAPGRRHRL